MSKTKVVLAALVAVFALSAVAASTASAEDMWFVNGSLLTTTKAIANTAAVMEKGELTFSETTIKCEGNNLEGTEPKIEFPDKGATTSLTFTECKTVAGSKCELAEGAAISIGTVPITALAVLGTGTEVKATFKPKTKATFATINFTGASCALSGIQPVTGSATISAPTGTVENTLQEIVANTASGELKVGTAAATLKGKALLRLVSGEPWSFHN